MAKKKKRAAKTARLKSGKSGNRASKKKAVKKTSSAKKKPRVASKKTSVDALLKQFAKDRAQGESQLDGLQKKREELEERVSKFQEQISKLRQQESEAKTRLADLDSRRDREVAELLTGLGVNLSRGDSNPSTADSNSDGNDDDEAKPVLTFGRKNLN